MTTQTLRGLLFGFGFSFWAASVAPAFDIASFGSPRAVIVTGENPSPVVRTMAAELTNYLDRIVTGASFRISERPVGGMNSILLGTPWTGKKMDEFAIFVNGKGDLELTGEGSRGTVYATYAFLEQLGVRFWSWNQETVPTAKKLALPGNFRRVEAPAFGGRSLWGEGASYPGWCAKLRINGTCGASKALPASLGGSYRVPMGETLALGNISPKKYYQDHPEWYALRLKNPDDKPGLVAVKEGKDPGSQVAWRNGEDKSAALVRNSAQVCPTCPDVHTQLVAEIREELTRHPDRKFIPIGLNDNDAYCRCRRCAALAHAHGDRRSALMVDLANDVLRAIAKDFPEVKIVILAYWGAESAPEHITGEPNLCVAYAQGLYLYNKGPLDRNPGVITALKEWKKVAPGGVAIWAYYACFANYLVPYYDYDYMGSNFRLYKKFGAMAISPQLPWGTFADFVDLRCWLFGQLAWNPDQDEHRLIDEWIDGTCGKGAPYMRDYVKVQARIRDVGKKDFLGGATAADYLTIRGLFAKALDATKDDAAAFARIEKLSAGFLAETILRYRSKNLSNAAKAANVALPKREELIDQLEALAKKYKAGAWKEARWDFAEFIQQLKDRKD